LFFHEKLYIIKFFFCVFHFFKFKISIIIPIYKAEKYLNDCLDSLINQSLTNIQIICINDESPDNSLNILKEYSKKDKRIIIKNIKHVSISETRNEGLKYVEGEYIGFVDDDDFIDLNQYEKVYEFAKKDDIDLLEFGKQNINENQKLKDFKNRNIIYKDEEVIKNIDGNILKELGNTIWNKIYKTKIIKKNNITFVPNLGGEDLNFNLKIYPFVKKLKRIYTQTYFWRNKKIRLYDPIKYFYGSNKLFFENLVGYYKINKLNINNPILCIELMIIGYKHLFWSENLFYKEEYLTNFFNAFKKLEINEEKIINKLTIEFKTFYLKILNKYKLININKKKDL
jgi:glycosyltransferase involved in cell wall biosynthesis